MSEILLLDQMALSCLVTKPTSRDTFLASLRLRDVKIALNFAHVVETAKWGEPNSSQLCDLVEKLPTIQLRLFAEIIVEEVQHAFWKHLGHAVQAVKAMGSIFSDYPGFSFRDCVSRTVSSTIKGKPIDDPLKKWEVVDVPVIFKERMKDPSFMKDVANELRYAWRAMKQLLKNDSRLWVTPQGTIASSESVVDGFLESLNLESCPYLKTYMAFMSFRYRSLNRDRMRGDLPDAEHAVHAAVTCDGFVTERDVADLLQQMEAREILCKARIARMSDGWETLEFI